MDAASFERVYDSFPQFHAFFAASFGRKQWREHSRNYLQALLVQARERRNAGNLSESVGICRSIRLRGPIYLRRLQSWTRTVRVHRSPLLYSVECGLAQAQRV